MPEPVDLLERRIDALRAEIRRAVAAGDTSRTRGLRAELRAAERAWEQAITDLAAEVGGEAPPPVPARGSRAPARGSSLPVRGSLVPVREQVHHALTLLSVPAAPRLIAEVHAAFFGVTAFGATATGLAANRLTHLRRDEKRSFEAAPHSRPYHLCAALTAAHLAPARGLIAVSTWPLERRIVGPLSARVDFLTAAVRVAQRAGTVPEGSDAVNRLLWRFATNIPGAIGSPGTMFDRHDTVDLQLVIRAAEAECAVHADADRAHRTAAADRARRHLDEVRQLFGNTLQTVGGKTA
ncbi:hypothetical protein ACN28C_02530 [Plantactinospora sp. WMMC1484]|uniref:hypothetical protein n=1 Tax=Plantactinospora sp. WMMC1484 TaxID=3404122 RepID=UPI003BF55476